MAVLIGAILAIFNFVVSRVASILCSMVGRIRMILAAVVTLILWTTVERIARYGSSQSGAIVRRSLNAAVLLSYCVDVEQIVFLLFPGLSTQAEEISNGQESDPPHFPSSLKLQSMETFPTLEVSAGAAV